MKKITYYLLDVFTQRQYGGNQLAVFLDLDDQLTGKDMLQMAREINFAESTFIKKRLADQHYTVKIFTPESEIPFAGHPTIGTSFVIANHLLSTPASTILLDLNHATIEVHIATAEKPASSLFVMTQAPPNFLQTFTADALATGLGLDPATLSEGLPIQEISTGLPFLIVPLRNLAAMRQIQLTAPQLKDFLLRHDGYKSTHPEGLSTSLFFFTSETFENQNDYHTRMFCIEDDVLKEDAATGSANGCLLAYLLRYRAERIRARVEQGFLMNRKSYLHLDGTRRGDHYELKVGGHAKLVAKGEWWG